MDIVMNIIVYGNQLYDNIWNTLMSYMLDKSISPQQIKILMGSFGQFLNALGRLFNSTKQDELAKNRVQAKFHEKALPLTSIQVDVTNYIIVMGFMTFLIFQLARYVQRRNHIQPH